MRRFECLQVLAKTIAKETLVVCNLQDTTYEWNHLRPSDANLLRMGMALVTPVALGLALALPHRRVLALDGDGSMLLGLGTLTTLGEHPPRNLLVVVFDNQAYNSAGGIPTFTAGKTKIAGMALAAGVDNSVEVTTVEEFERRVTDALAANELWLVVAKVDRRPEPVPRPTIDGQENKYRFVRFVEALENSSILPADEQKSYL